MSRAWRRCGLWLSGSLLALACAPRETLLPEPYRSLPVPEGRLASAAALAAGAELFQRHCALCHGERGDGRGVRNQNLSRPPRDLRSRGWRKRQTPRLVYFTVREGVAGTPMPGFRALSEEQCWDLSAHVLALAEAAQ